MNKYLFLDIDGVLNSMRTAIAFNSFGRSVHVTEAMLLGKRPEVGLDPVAVALLKQLQEEIGFKIIISSTWRKELSLKAFHFLFKECYNWDTENVIGGKTPEIHEIGSVRGHEIKKWLDTHAQTPYTYAILDDNSDMLPEQLSQFVQTTIENGFSFENYQRIQDILGDKDEAKVSEYNR